MSNGSLSILDLGYPFRLSRHLLMPYSTGQIYKLVRMSYNQPYRKKIVTAAIFRNQNFYLLQNLKFTDNLKPQKNLSVIQLNLLRKLLVITSRLKLKFYIFTNLFNMDGLDKAAYFTKMASSDNLIDYPMRFEYQDLFTMTQLVIIYFIVKNKTYIIEIVISNALCYPLFISVS